ncbi:MAG: SGNH/GDSL hydrolase family protein [Gemmatimonadaceae bacterium]
MIAARILLPFLALALAGCADLSSGPDEDAANLNRYVAMGTSISMGGASDGVVAESQQSSWPALLAAGVGAEFGLPLIEAPGCRPPLVAPLQNFRRAGDIPSSDLSTCSPNMPGFNLPEQNVAIYGATAASAVNATPAGANNPLYGRVLAAGQTQVTAMRSMAPTFVSVEFGADELLRSLSGLVSDATPFATFSSAYSSIITSLRQVPAKALLVLLPTDFRNFPAIRPAAQITAQRSAFAARNVTVNANCDASTSYVSLPNKVVPLLATGAVRAAAGLGPVDLSCADAANVRDGILTETDMTALGALAVQMNTLITNRANAGGYATFSLGSLYDTVGNGVQFDLGTMLTSSTPFGALISLDGIHPSAAGQAVLANAARAAILEKYGSITH